MSKRLRVAPRMGDDGPVHSPIQHNQLTDERLAHILWHEDTECHVCPELAEHCLELRKDNRRLAQRTQELAAELETLRCDRLPWRLRLRIWWAKRRLR